MGVDISKIHKRVEEEAAKTAAKNAKNTNWSFKYWTPKPGKNSIRLMPPWTYEGGNAGQFWREIYMHWQIGSQKRSFPCPQKTPNGPNTPCPICAEVDRLRATRDPMDYELADKLRSKSRFYSNIVDLDDPVFTDRDVAEWKNKQRDATRECPLKVGETKVQVYSYGPMVMKELLDVFADGADITHPTDGRNVIVTHDGGNPPKFRTRPDLKQTAFVVQGADLESRLVDLDSIQGYQDPLVMSAALTGDAMPEETHLPAPRSSATLPAPSSAQEAPPACFKDPNVHSKTDPECVGGVKGVDVFDRCPVFDPCATAVDALIAPQPTRRRTHAKTEAVTDPNNSIAALEAEMKKLIR